MAVTEPWTPTLEQVADHIPTRTRDSTQPGDETLLGTFTAETTPTDEQANRIIRRAVTEVLSSVGGVVPASPAYLYEMASAAAALRAAADIELTYPARQSDPNLYERLDQRAKDALDALKDAINAPGAGPEARFPQYSFPTPTWPGDYPV
ncbi:hypothetical protein [Sphaerisporangium sp. NPDC051011]|uniref:hypothetical protein n=1 Tax=Sphaerisporangium sp. NPDC051011 TaxID=3155792 RepID=UPI0034012117